MQSDDKKLLIGIDPGVNTGYAEYDLKSKKLVKVTSMKIHEVMLYLDSINAIIGKVYVEDARKRKWFGDRSDAKLQGAGSVKRDCKIWEEFLTDKGIPFELVAPKNNKTKTRQQEFFMYTGWQGRTNEHARDAAMLLIGR